MWCFCLCPWCMHTHVCRHAWLYKWSEARGGYHVFFSVVLCFSPLRWVLSPNLKFDTLGRLAGQCSFRVCLSIISFSHARLQACPAMPAFLLHERHASVANVLTHSGSSQSLDDCYKVIDLFILLQAKALCYCCANLCTQNMAAPQTLRSGGLRSKLKAGANLLFVYSQLRLFVNLAVT